MNTRGDSDMEMDDEDDQPPTMGKMGHHLSPISAANRLNNNNNSIGKNRMNNTIIHYSNHQNNNSSKKPFDMEVVDF